MENTVKISGVVSQVSKKATQYGDMYDVVIAGQKVGLGKDFAGLQAGDHAEVLALRKGNYLNAVKGTLQKLATPAAQTAKAPDPTAGMGKDQYWNNKEANDAERQRQITWQASRNAAIELVTLIHAAGGVNIPKTATPAKIAAAFEALVRGYTQKFFDETTGNATEAEDTEVEDDKPKHW